MNNIFTDIYLMIDELFMILSFYATAYIIFRYFFKLKNTNATFSLFYTMFSATKKSNLH